MRRALIVGVSGQDGAYLSQLLLQKGYWVAGTSRDARSNSWTNLRRLGVHGRVHTLSLDTGDPEGVARVLEETHPDEIYNLAGQSSVGLSFERPLETFASISLGMFHVLEAIRRLGLRARVFNACSSECFGDTGENAADEGSPFRPHSPYAVAKAAAYWAAANYRDAYGLWVCSAILFNHESPLRSERFVTSKIVGAACRIARGSGERLRLGTLTIVRDWGWAPEYVDAMWRLLQQELPRDYVVASGSSSTLEDFVREIFAALDLDWRAHVEVDPALGRPSEPRCVRGDARRIARDLGWSARCRLPELARRLVRAARESA